MANKLKEVYRTKNRLDMKSKSDWHILTKTRNIQANNIKNWKTIYQVTYKIRHSKIIPDFSMEILKTKSSRVGILQTLRDCTCYCRLLNTAKLLKTIDGEWEVFCDKLKFKHIIYKASHKTRMRCKNLFWTA